MDKASVYMAKADGEDVHNVSARLSVLGLASVATLQTHTAAASLIQLILLLGNEDVHKDPSFHRHAGTAGQRL